MSDPVQELRRRHPWWRSSDVIVSFCLAIEAGEHLKGGG